MGDIVVASQAAGALATAYQAANIFRGLTDVIDRVSPALQRYRAQQQLRRDRLAQHRETHSSNPAVKTITQSQPQSGMPHRGYKRGRGSSKRAAKKPRTYRRVNKKFKKAKKNKNYKYLSKIPIPIGGLTQRKVVRLIGVDCIHCESGQSGTLVDGVGDAGSALTPIVWRSFCLNDLFRWRTYLYRPDENPQGGTGIPSSKIPGFIPGWDLWKDRYNTYEVVGAKVKVTWTNLSNSQTTTQCGFNITHDRRQLGAGPSPDPPTDANLLHDRCNDLAEGFKLLTSEDILRSKLFTMTSVTQSRATGQRRTQTTGFNSRKAYPIGSGNDYVTSAPTATVGGEAAGPGRPQNRTYMTLIAAPTLSASPVELAVKIEVEWIVVYSDLKEQFKSTQQAVQDSFRYENAQNEPIPVITQTEASS